MGWHYENNPDNTARFVLGTKGKSPLVCFGINPSTATPDCLDNTLRSVERIARNSGYDSWIMLNIYPQRATNPNALHKALDGELHRSNLVHIEKILAKYKPQIWAAWGTLIEKRTYLANCLSDIIEITDKHQCTWISFGKASKNGHPHHPLYLRQNEPSNEFLMRDYLKRLGCL